MRAALERGVQAGLASDISSVPAGSICETPRLAIAASRMAEGGFGAHDRARGDSGTRVDFRTAFHPATASDGAAFGLPVGHFTPGMQFDAMAIASAAPQGGIRL